MSREQVYGRRPVREALRGRARGARAVGDGARRRSPRRGSARRSVRASSVKLDRDLSEAAGTRDHQGVLAWCEPFRYADAYELAAGERPLLACLDQVSDPRNLGAVLPQRRRARARPASSSRRTARRA